MATDAPTSAAEVSSALDAHRRRRWRLPRWCGDPAQAAVAAILRDGASGPEILLIRRAERPGDPWSGDMGFPGGRVGPGDADALEGAIRETREETGVVLTRTQMIGRLSDVLAVSHGRPRPMVVTPFVFIAHEAEELRLNHEVDEALWAPLAHFADPARRGRMRWRLGLRVRIVRYQGRVVWGLTLGMLDELTAVVWGRRSRRARRWR